MRLLGAHQLLKHVSWHLVLNFATWRSWSLWGNGTHTTWTIPVSRELRVPPAKASTFRANSVMPCRGSGIGRHETFARGTWFATTQLLLVFRGSVGLLYAACHIPWRARVKTVRQRSLAQLGQKKSRKSWKWIEDHQEMDGLCKLLEDHRTSPLEKWPNPASCWPGQDETRWGAEQG